MTSDLDAVGDILAETLGRALATMERGEDFTPAKMAAARRIIAIWHRTRAKTR